MAPLLGEYASFADAAAVSREDDDVIERSVAQVVACRARGPLEIRSCDGPVLALVAGYLAEHPGATVVDFGGGPETVGPQGLLYDTAAALMPLRGPWIVWETPEKAAACAQFADERLSFSSERPARADVVIASGVLQYVPEPYATAAELAELGADLVILNRVPLANRAHVVVQRRRSGATLPLHIFQTPPLPGEYPGDYRVVATWNDDFDGTERLDDGDVVSYRGYALRREGADAAP